MVWLILRKKPEEVPIIQIVVTANRDKIKTTYIFFCVSLTLLNRVWSLRLQKISSPTSQLIWKLLFASSLPRQVSFSSPVYLALPNVHHMRWLPYSLTSCLASCELYLKCIVLCGSQNNCGITNVKKSGSICSSFWGQLCYCLVHVEFSIN